MTKKYWIPLIAAALTMTAGLGTTYAYLTAQDSVENTFDAAEVDITVEEGFEPTPPEPGKVIKKAPRIRSDSDTDCYVRMRYEFTSSDAEKLCESVKTNPGWTKKSDGYYYWNSIVKPGGETGTLFDRIQIRSGITAEEIIPFDILVYAEAVQAKGQSLASAWASVD